MEYAIEYDTIASGCLVDWFTSDNVGEVVKHAREVLKLHEGGHADIFNEEDNFVTDVEV